MVFLAFSGLLSPCSSLGLVIYDFSLHFYGHLLLFVMCVRCCLVNFSSEIRPLSTERRGEIHKFRNVSYLLLLMLLPFFYSLGKLPNYWLSEDERESKSKKIVISNQSFTLCWLLCNTQQTHKNLAINSPLFFCMPTLLFHSNAALVFFLNFNELWDGAGAWVICCVLHPHTFNRSFGLHFLSTNAARCLFDGFVAGFMCPTFDFWGPHSFFLSWHYLHRWTTC